MNIFSVLDVSDNEEEVKKPVVKKASKEAKPESGKDEKEKEKKEKDAKPKAAKDTKAKDSKPQQAKAAAPAAAPVAEPEESEAIKESHRSDRGKTHRHGEKNHGKEQDPTRRPKREFDRRSGTGRGKEVSRGGRGPYGLGSVEQEAQDAEKHPDAVQEGAAAGEEGEQTEAAAPEVVVETSLSYEEFLRKREEARAASSLLAPAKATRVVDVAAQLAGLKAVEEGEDTYIAAKVVKASSVKKDQRSSGKLAVSDVAFKFESATANEYRKRDDNRDNREFRGGRGEGRGDRRTRPAPAAGAKKAPTTVFNSGDFPSL